jgi:hypothetical protein
LVLSVSNTARTRWIMPGIAPTLGTPPTNDEP